MTMTIFLECNENYGEIYSIQLLEQRYSCRWAQKISMRQKYTVTQFFSGREGSPIM
jgi:hypothetical protein